jgi:hypothetical protein
MKDKCQEDIIHEYARLKVLDFNQVENTRVRMNQLTKLLREGDWTKALRIMYRLSGLHDDIALPQAD